MRASSLSRIALARMASSYEPPGTCLGGVLWSQAATFDDNCL